MPMHCIKHGRLGMTKRPKQAKRLELVSEADFHLAYDRWKHNVDDSSRTGTTLMEFLGCKTFYGRPDFMAMRPEAAHKIRLLVGPHWQTILKAWKIRQSK